jgi:hypothetical protein
MERMNGTQPAPFSFKAVKKNGEIIQGVNCILTSSYTLNNTVNIKFSNGQMRKLRKVGIIELNGQEVTL